MATKKSKNGTKKATAKTGAKTKAEAKTATKAASAKKKRARRPTTRVPKMSSGALEEQLRAVRAIGEILATSVGLEALFRKIVPQISHLMHAERSTLFLYDPQADEIWSKIAEGDLAQIIRLPIGKGLAGWVAEHRKPLNIEDAYIDDRFNRSVDIETGFKTDTIAAAPVINRKGELVGVLQVLNRHGGAFSDEDIGLLETIAVQMSFAIENARQAQELIDNNIRLQLAQQESERRREEIDLLYEMEQKSAASKNLDELLDSMIVETCARLRSRAGSVLLMDDESGRLFFRGVEGEHKSELLRLSLSADEGVVGWVARTGKPALLRDPSSDKRHDPTVAEALKFPAEALLAVPMFWDEKVIGAVEVLNPYSQDGRPADYDDEDLKILTVIAGQIARAVATTTERERHMETEHLTVLGRMLAGVAHDLRNPMTVISGYAQIMAMEPDGSRRGERCAKILSQVDEMTAMVSDLLAFARGDSRLRPATINIDTFASGIEDIYRMQCGPRGINITVHSAGGDAFIDLSRAKRVVGNLAKNALDVLDSGGNLHIELGPFEGGLKLLVKDDGPGIPSDIRARFFEPFVTLGKASGTGLGLSIVKRFVEDHGGTINVQSEPGAGTIFRVELPRAEEPKSP